MQKIGTIGIHIKLKHVLLLSILKFNLETRGAKKLHYGVYFDSTTNQEYKCFMNKTFQTFKYKMKDIKEWQLSEHS